MSTLELHRDGTFVVSREPGVDLLILDPPMSRRHASITLAGDTVTLTGLGSTNGTLLRGQRIATPAALQREDEFRIGDASIRFQVLASEHLWAQDCDEADFPRRVVVEIERSLRAGESLTVALVRFSAASTEDALVWSGRRSMRRTEFSRGRRRYCEWPVSTFQLKAKQYRLTKRAP
jgi:hypothetical protein